MSVERWFLHHEHPANKGAVDAPTGPCAYSVADIDTPRGPIHVHIGLRRGLKDREQVARKIAAAPELLESLRECAAYVKREIDSLVDSHTHPDTKQIDPDDLAYIDAERQILARAEAAIAKVEVLR